MRSPITPHWSAEERRLIDRYFAGECSSTDAERARELLSGHRSVEDAVLRLRADDLSVTPQDLAHLWSRIASRTVTPERALSRPRGSRRFSTVSGFVATGLLVAAGLTLGARYTPSIFRSVPELRSQEYVTRRGQQATLMLTDGSAVVLAPSSALRYTEPFGGDGRSRQLQLEGEALFTVTHADREPFLVQTRHSTTRVLGTVFAVRHYATDTVARVVVAAGKVAFSAGDAAPVVLSTGDLARAAAGRAATVLHRADVVTALGWVDHKLNFDGVSLRNAIPDLERQYDIDIHVPDESLAALRITAAFSTRSIDDMLTTLGFLLDARVIRKGRSVTLIPLNVPRGNSTFQPMQAPRSRTSPLEPDATNRAAVMTASDTF